MVEALLSKGSQFEWSRLLVGYGQFVMRNGYVLYLSSEEHCFEVNSRMFSLKNTPTSYSNKTHVKPLASTLVQLVVRPKRKRKHYLSQGLVIDR